jgi:hypothetical protein
LAGFLLGSPERQKWPLGGGRISLPWPLGWIAATPSGRIYLCFFFFFCHSPEKSPEMTVVDGVCSPEVAVDDGGQRLSSLVVVMIGCFDFILNLCFFLKRMRCQHVIGGKKTPLFAMTGWQQHSYQ